MNLVWYPLAAMGGGIVGVLAHELIHIAAAFAFDALEGVGWQGGLAGGPYVDFRTDSRVASEIIRKAPILYGALAAVGALLTIEATPTWVFLAAVAAGLLWTSPEDLFLSRAEASAGE